MLLHMYKQNYLKKTHVQAARWSLLIEHGPSITGILICFTPQTARWICSIFSKQIFLQITFLTLPSPHFSTKLHISLITHIVESITQTNNINNIYQSTQMQLCCCCCCAVAVPLVVVVLLLQQEAKALGGGGW
jgi:hypothetical protein